MASLEKAQLPWGFGRRHSQSQDPPVEFVRASGGIDLLREELCQSQTALSAVLAHYRETVTLIPEDINQLKDGLTRILSAAEVQADLVRAEAEQSAMRIFAEAQRERQTVARLRADMEVEIEKARADIVQLRRQASFAAEELLTEAENYAGELLSRAKNQIDIEATFAQDKLDEVNALRSGIIQHIMNFYREFSALECEREQVD